MVKQIIHKRISKKGKPFIAGSRKGPELMMAKVGPEYLRQAGWFTERKFDGFRAVIVRNGDVVRIFGRSRKEYTNNFPEIVREAKWFKDKHFVLDAEITYLDKKGNDQFKPVQMRAGIKDTARMFEYIEKYPVKAFIFDILYHQGVNVMSEELVRRKVIIGKLFCDAKLDGVSFSHIMQTDFVKTPDSRKKLLSEQKRLGREGVMHKNPLGTYQPGVRSSDWRKHKFTADEDVIIIGYQKGEGKFLGTLGCLYTGMMKDGKVYYTGKIGTGYTDDERHRLKSFLDKYEVQTPKPGQIIQLYEKIGAAEVNRGVWVEPRFVIMIKYFEFSNDKRFRHGVFIRLRPDKKPSEVDLP
jgi:bifunctional non-homologous end joining protein LigD